MLRSGQDGDDEVECDEGTLCEGAMVPRGGSLVLCGVEYSTTNHNLLHHLSVT